MGLHPFFEKWALPSLSDVGFVRDQGLRWVLRSGNVRITVQFQSFDHVRGYDLLACHWDLWADSLASLPPHLRSSDAREGELTIPPTMTADMAFYRGNDALTKAGVQQRIWRVTTSNSDEYGEQLRTRIDGFLLPAWQRAATDQNAELTDDDLTAVKRVTFPARFNDRSQTNQQRHVINLVAQEVFNDPFDRVDRLLADVSIDEPENVWVQFWKTVRAGPIEPPVGTTPTT